MSALLEVTVLTPHDAAAAEQGGADRVVVVGSPELEGLSPTPDVVHRVRAATSVQVRVVLRLREGFSTDGGELARLRGLAASYADAGADGMVLGFLNGYDEVDVEVCQALVADADWPWTFHRAVDATLAPDTAWRTIRRLPRVDTVLTAGSPRGMEHGLDDVLARARADADVAGLVMAGGGLLPEHVPWLVKAGVRKFQVGASVRPRGDWKDRTDEALVRAWRRLVDGEVRHEAERLRRQAVGPAS